MAAAGQVIKMGRKPLPEAQRLDYFLTIRLDVPLYKLLANEARDLGLPLRTVARKRLAGTFCGFVATNSGK